VRLQEGGDRIARLSLPAYGVFNVVLDGRILSYRYLLKEEFFQLLAHN